MPMNDYCVGVSYLAQAPFSPGTDRRTYRVEMQGNTMRLLVDGVRVLETKDNTHLKGGHIGLWSQNVVLNVYNFKVTRLP